MRTQDRNLRKNWTSKVNAILKEIQSGNITKTNRSMCHICGKKSSWQTIPKKRKCFETTLAEKKNTVINTRTTEK